MHRNKTSGKKHKWHNIELALNALNICLITHINYTDQSETLSAHAQPEGSTLYLTLGFF